jgi:hypothetical protein
MELTEQDRQDLKVEIDHIFDSGANNIRLSEMMDRFISQKTGSLDVNCLGETQDMEYLEKNLLASLKKLPHEIKYPEVDGFYKHYKGGVYKFMSMSEHTETGEKLVIYQSLLFGSIYARPLEIWNESVNVGSEVVPRFKKMTT